MVSQSGSTGYGYLHNRCQVKETVGSDITFSICDVGRFSQVGTGTEDP